MTVIEQNYRNRRIVKGIKKGRGVGAIGRLKVLLQIVLKVILRKYYYGNLDGQPIYI